MSAESNVPSPEFEEVYSNSFLRGLLVVPFARAILLSFALVWWLLPALFLLSPVYFAFNWHETLISLSKRSPKEALAASGGAVVAVLLGVLFVGVILYLAFSYWRQFFLIARSRLYVANGSALSTVEGTPVFSGARKTSRSYVDVNKLHISGREFDLNCCGRVKSLLKVRERSFVDVSVRESTDPGTDEGFKLRVPMRVWYVPSTGVMVRAELPAIGQAQWSRRIDVLEQRLARFEERHKNDYSQAGFAKSMKLRTELEELRVQMGAGLSPELRRSAEDRLKQLDRLLGSTDLLP